MTSYDELTPGMKKYVDDTILLIQDDAYWADGVAPGEDDLRQRLSDLVMSVLDWQDGTPRPLPPRTNPHN